MKDRPGQRLVVSSLVLFLLLFLAACGQNLVDPSQTQLTSQDFGTAVDEAGMGIAANTTGVYVVGGTFGNLDGVNKGESDAFLRKYKGGVVWAQQFGTGAGDGANAVAVSPAGNSYVLGVTYGALGVNLGQFDVFLRKYNRSGGVVWTRQFGTVDGDSPTDVALDSHGYVYVLSQDNLNLNSFTLRKFNRHGVLITSRTVASLPGLAPRALAVDSTGNVVVLANWSDNISNYIRVFKFTKTLADVWNVPFQQTGNNDYGFDITTFGTDIYVAARLSSDLFAPGTGAVYGQLNRAGTTLAVRQLESTPPCFCTLPRSITVDRRGNIYIAGSTRGDFPGFTNAGLEDIVVFKYNRANTPVWVRQFGQGTFGTSEDDLAFGIAVSDAVYVTGSTNGNLLGAPKYSNPPINDTDAYLAKLDKTTGAVLGIDQ